MKLCNGRVTNSSLNCSQDISHQSKFLDKCKFSVVEGKRSEGNLVFLILTIWKSGKRKHLYPYNAIFAGIKHQHFHRRALVRLSVFSQPNNFHSIVVQLQCMSSASCINPVHELSLPRVGKLLDFSTCNSV